MKGTYWIIKAITSAYFTKTACVFSFQRTYRPISIFIRNPIQHMMTTDITNVNEYVHPRWDELWNKGIAAGELFDKGETSPLLLKYLHEERIPVGRALVPGCGRGYDVTALASNNRYVVGIDMSQAAVTSGINRLNDIVKDGFIYSHQIEFICGSFFDLETNDETMLFDFVYDYTFLCALDPSIRKDWALKMSQLLKPGGELLTLIFPIKKDESDVSGPPFRVTMEDYSNLLLPVGFDCLECRLLPSELCHPDRDGGPPKFWATAIGYWKKNCQTS
eukprot:gene13412-17986_t